MSVQARVTSCYYASKANPPYSRKTALLVDAFERPCILQLVVIGLKRELKEDQSHAEIYGNSILWVEK